jgi:3'-phosphoadenosine 5'-phosphosulfate sulfotransferase (PAPS reductase)/FAD synthetase
MKPYELPEGNVMISFSGGRTSGFMLHEVLKANGPLPERCKVLFANTGREMPETLDFVQECSDRWNVKITWLEYARRENKVTFDVVSHNSASRDGAPLAEVIRSRNYLPNVMTRFCTQEAKVKTIKRHLVSLGWKRWVNTVGIRADEAHRVKPSSDNRWVNWFPLADVGATTYDVMSFWRSQPFDLRVIKGGGNCDGCFLKSEATLAAMHREHPERMEWWANFEKEIGSTFHKSRSYTQIKSFVDRQGDWIFDDEEYLCQKNDGECTG